MKEQTFFSDPAIDRLMTTVLALAGEVHVSRTRQRALESLLVKANVITPEALEAWQPSAPERAQAEAELAQMVRQLFQPLLALNPVTKEEAAR